MLRMRLDHEPPSREEVVMRTTIRGRFQDPTQAKNTRDDLINAGIPQEQIHVDRDTQTIRVMMPSEEKAEILEIFDRHGVAH
jgi:hypothetical protein